MPVDNQDPEAWRVFIADLALTSSASAACLLADLCKHYQTCTHVRNKGGYLHRAKNMSDQRWTYLRTVIDAT